VRTIAEPVNQAARRPVQQRAATRPSIEERIAPLRTPDTNETAPEPRIREAALNPALGSPKGFSIISKAPIEPPQIKIPPPPLSDINPEWVERIIRDAAGPALPELDVASFELGGALEVPRRPKLPEALEGLNMAMLRDTEISLEEGRQQARNSLRQFLAKAQRPPAGTHSHALKIMLRHEGRQERVWVGDLEGPLARKPKPNEKLYGHLLNLPEVIRELNFGDRVAFIHDDIEDWTYIDTQGRFAGNFTGCALIATKGEEGFVRFVQEHRLDCRWLSIIQPVAN
jgi:uncharacterized protein YegJ (DUF2314 family)